MPSSTRQSQILGAQSPEKARAGGKSRGREEVCDRAQHRAGTRLGLTKGYLMLLGTRVMQSKEPWRTPLCNAVG